MGLSQSWRELLGSSIEQPQERKRIARELSVAPVTLTRWVTGESNPRFQHLHNLLHVLPQKRDELQELIVKEFPDFQRQQAHGGQEKTPIAIPQSFYESILHTYATVPGTLLFETLCNLILLQVLDHLDYARIGMAVIVVRCMPPSEHGKVHSLRECVGRGTPPWRSHLEQQAVLLGSESLAGHAISTGHVTVNARLDEIPRFATGYRDQWERSAAASPIMCRGLIAGSLLVSSSQLDFFRNDHLRLIQNYAELLGLAFDANTYYQPGEIDLWPLPLAAVQRPYLDTFRQRVIALMVETGQQGHSLTLAQAEQTIWQRIEREMFSAFISDR